MLFCVDDMLNHHIMSAVKCCRYKKKTQKLKFKNLFHFEKNIIVIYIIP